MKIYAFNGSPRKKWNCDLLLDSFTEGVKSVDETAEVEKVHLYDLNFKGCRSCFACKMKRNPDHCMINDDAQKYLTEAREADGIVLASPIYYFDVSGVMRCFIERLLYPGAVKNPVQTAAVYAMNADEDTMNRLFRNHLNDLKAYMESAMHTEMTEIFSHDTFQREDNPDLYRPSKMDHAAKKARREVQFPLDRQKAFEAGAAMAKRILEK